MNTPDCASANPCQATDSLDSSFVEPFDCVAIVGVGLMGGSLGMALREQGLTRRVLGIDVQQEVLEKAVSVGAIDAGAVTLSAIAAADCIVFATPVVALYGALESAAPFIRPDALVTDLGSVKARIVALGERLFGSRFVGGHPMSGSEVSGIEAARSDLFEGAAWAVVRSEDFAPGNDPPACRLIALVNSLRARPMPMNAERHDRIAALVSHLPHLLSFAFARTVEADPYREQAREMAGGSFRDLTRVSFSDPQLWRDIFLDNEATLIEVIALYESRLALLKQAIETKDAVNLLHCLRSSK